MSKRSWKDSGLEDLGVSRSLLRDLDVVDSMRDNLRGVDKALDLTAQVRESNASLDLARRAVDLGALDRLRTEVLGTRTAFSAAAERIAEARAPLGGLSADLERASLWKNMKTPIFPSAKETLLGSEFRSTFENFIKPSQELPGFASILKNVKGLNEIARPHSPGFIYTNVAADANRAAVRAASSVFGSVRPWNLHLSEVRSGGFSAKTLNDIFGHADTIEKVNSAAFGKRAWMPDLHRSSGLFGASTRGLMDIARGNFDLGFGQHLGGILDVVRNIDWESVERAARIRDARRPRTRVGRAALAAYDAFHMGHTSVVDRFMIDFLDIRPTAERREALWVVLGQAFARTLPYPATWIVLDDAQAVIYLRKAVYLEERRNKRDREMADRIWWPEGEEDRDREGVPLSKPTLVSGVPADLLFRASPGPEELLIAGPDDRGQVLDLLYREGSPEDKEFVRLLRTGYELADISRAYDPQKVQRFKKKARRWRKIKLDPLTDG